MVPIIQQRLIEKKRKKRSILIDWFDWIAAFQLSLHRLTA